MKNNWIKLMVAAAALFSYQVLADVDYRLPEHIEPSFQQITLKVDPDVSAYSGSTSIDISVSKTTKRVGFYHIGLEIVSATLTAGETNIPLTVSAGKYDIHWANSDSDIAPGKYTLNLEFTGQVNVGSDGMYLSKFEDRNYVFTQFEDMHARRAFPSFDEPDFKIPYQMTISSPEKHVVVSNTPVMERSVNEGWQTVKFDKTKPMPTYLIALAIGEMDSVDITGLSVPGKIYTPKGKTHQTKFAIKHTPGILTALESYFGIDYPYKKLDFVAVPNFTFGAMENVGLVTYSADLLLLEDEPQVSSKRSTLNVIAHELAHMWYGNLVTMKWWDDLWLNEAFATWKANKAVIAMYPELNVQYSLPQNRAMGTDALTSTKPVKKIVRTAPDVMDGLGLNYMKGHAILNMAESLVGEEAFQKGVRAYMKDMAWQNATADDLWQALSSVSDVDLPKIMKTYLEQPGYALVDFADDGKITQKRFLFVGADAPEQLWEIPLQVKYKIDGDVKNTSIMMSDQTEISSKLAEADWLFPDADGLGYYRWKVPAKKLEALLADISSLNVREKLSLLANSDALVQSGEQSIAEHLKVIAVLAKDENPRLVNSVMNNLTSYATYLVNDDTEELFATYLQDTVYHWYEKLGLQAVDGEDSDITSLRNSVFGALGRYTKNNEIIAKSNSMAKQYLKDPKSVPSSLALRALRTTAKHDDGTLYDTYINAYVKNTDPNFRGTVRASMFFEQPENIQKFLDFTFNPESSSGRAIYGIAVVTRVMDDDALFYNWLEKNFDKLVEKLPTYHIARMPEFVSNSCNAKDIARAQAFYSQKTQEGIKRSLEVSQEASKQCLTLKTKYQDDFSQFLKSYTASRG